MSDRLTGRAGVAAVVLLAGLVYLVGNGAVALWDRDEPRYAQSSRQMVQSGDWVVPRLYDEPRTAKPPLIYWLQASSMMVLGDTAFAARLPSAIAMALTLALFGGAVRAIVGPRRAPWSVLVLASSVMVLITAKASTTDSVLLLWITTAQLCLYAIWRGRRTWPVWLTFAISVGVGGLTKGPVVLGVLGMTLVALWLLGRTVPRQARARSAAGRSAGLASTLVKGVVAVVIIAAIVAPWLYLVQQRSPGFVGTSVTHDVLRRVAQPLEGHKGPPGYHAATIWPFFLPWSLLLPLAMALGWKRRHLAPLRFSLAASLGPWIMFEIVRTKLPHYMLPTYPWLALLVADAIVRCLRGQHRDLAKRGFLTAFTILGLILVLAAAAPPAASVWFGESAGPGLAFAATGVVYVLVVYMLLRRGSHATGLAAMGVGVLAVWVVAWTVYLPRAQYLRVSVRVADVLRRQGATGPGQALMLDYKEPSLAFYQGGAIREHPATQLTADHLRTGTPWFVVTSDVWDRTAPDVRERVDVVDRFRGLAYAGGRVVEVMVVKAKGAQADPSTQSSQPSRAGADGGG